MNKEFEQNEIDGVEAVDLTLFMVGADTYTKTEWAKENMEKEIVNKYREFLDDAIDKGITTRDCPVCNGEKQIIRQTQSGLSYGYICPDCNK